MRHALNVNNIIHNIVSQRWPGSFRNSDKFQTKTKAYSIFIPR